MTQANEKFDLQDTTSWSERYGSSAFRPIYWCTMICVASVILTFAGVLLIPTPRAPADPHYQDCVDRGHSYSTDGGSSFSCTAP